MSILSVDTIQPIGSGSTVTLNAAKIVVGTGITFESNGQVIYAGIITATSFSGSGANLTSLPAANLTGTLPAISGANLTSLPAQATIANNADNRVITGGSGVNLNGEANLTFNGSALGLTGDLSVVGGWPKINLQATQASGENYQIAGAIQGVNNAGLCIRNTTDSVNILEIDTDSSRNLKVVSGNVIIGTSGKGIDFSATGGGSNTSNESELFDDYEEGSCAILIHDAAGSNISVTNNTFKYTKIGNRVFIGGSFTFAETGSKNGGLMVLYQLPFVPAQAIQATGTYWYDGTSDGADVTGVIYVSTNSSGQGYMKQSTTIGQPSNNKYLTFNEIQKNSSRPLHASFSYNVS